VFDAFHAVGGLALVDLLTFLLGSLAGVTAGLFAAVGGAIARLFIEPWLKKLKKRHSVLWKKPAR